MYFSYSYLTLITKVDYSNYNNIILPMDLAKFSNLE